MRLDALNWNIDWQQNTGCTCPVFSSATFHFTRHEDEMGCPGCKGIRDDCSCHLFPNLKMTAVALASKRLPRSAYRNSKLFVENGKCWDLTVRKEQSRQHAGWRWFSDSQCKTGALTAGHPVPVCRLTSKMSMENRALVHTLISYTSLQRHYERSDYSELQVYKNGPQRVNPGSIHPNI